MTAFVWFVSVLNAVVFLMALANCAAADARGKRLTALSAIVVHGGVSVWGFWVLLS